MCAGPAFATGKAETGSSSWRRHASISGSSGIASNGSDADVGFPRGGAAAHRGAPRRGRRGWSTEGYRFPEHPVQQACRDVHAEAAELDPEEITTGIDGCGIVTFALTLERMAHAFSRLASLDGGSRVTTAMRARPDLVGGPDGADFLLMRSAPGWLAKGGAEGLLCAAGPDGLGVALKTDDGSSRAHAPALAAFLGGFGVDLPGLVARPVLNTRGERVGEVVLRAHGPA